MPSPPSPKVQAGAAPPQTIPALAGPMAPSNDPRRYEPVKNTAQTYVYTYFTKPTGVTELFYNNNEREWVTVSLTLENAGPVDVGTSQNIEPVGSGKGRGLTTGVPIIITLPPSQRLYFVSNTINRVSVQISPFPWLWQILGTIERIAQTNASFVGGIVSGLARVFKGSK
jgi:hypothetical protein